MQNHKPNFEIKILIIFSTNQKIPCVLSPTYSHYFLTAFTCLSSVIKIGNDSLTFSHTIRDSEAMSQPGTSWLSIYISGHIKPMWLLTPIHCHLHTVHSCNKYFPCVVAVTSTKSNCIDLHYYDSLCFNDSIIQALGQFTLWWCFVQGS